MRRVRPLKGLPPCEWLRMEIEKKGANGPTGDAASDGLQETW